MTIIFIALIAGFILIITGFLIQKYPNVLAGSNPKERDEELVPLVPLVSKLCILAGIVILLGGSLLAYFGLEVTAVLCIVIPPLLIPIVIYSQKKGGLRKISNLLQFILWLVILLGVVGSVFYYQQNSDVRIEGDVLHIGGPYGKDINLDSITEFYTLDSLPKIQKRTQGLAISNTRKGEFILDQFGKTTLYLDAKEGPYFLFTTVDSSLYAINNVDTSFVWNLYIQFLKIAKEEEEEIVVIEVVKPKTRLRPKVVTKPTPKPQPPQTPQPKVVQKDSMSHKHKIDSLSIDTLKVWRKYHSADSIKKESLHFVENARDSVKLPKDTIKTE